MRRSFLIFTTTFLTALMLGSHAIPDKGEEVSVPSGEWTGRWWAGIARAEYDFSANPGGGWSAPNRAQGLRLTADGAVARVSPRNEGQAPWILKLGLRSLGRERSMTAVAPGTIRAEGNRVEQRRDSLGLTEWYANLRSGIEQGFTIDRRPDADSEGSPLVLDLFFEG
ncbi:MAG: hypothetical protein HYS34_03025, partial [Acidobacteria bacterium]|nr:hypothetical protein [Acidobacteriota bacterium]